MKKSKDGRYCTSVSYNGQKKSISGRTKSEAIRKAERARIAMKRGEQADERKTVAEYVKAYMGTYHISGSKHDETLLSISRNSITPELGRFKLASITPTILTNYLNGLEYGYWHASKVLQLLKAIFRQAHEDRLIPFDPAQNLRLPRGLDKGSHRKITDQERQMVLDTAAHHPAGLYVLIMLYTGLRPGEVAALCWGDIDLNRRRIYVRRALKRDDTIGPPKSDAGVRDVPIPDKLLLTLTAARKKKALPVIERATGGPLNNRTKDSLWKNFKRQMNLDHGAEVYRNRVVTPVVADDLTPYCLRHTYCTDLEAAGVPITVAAYLMGHSDIAITAKYYTHTSANIKALDDAADSINDLHTPPQKPDEHPKDVSLLDNADRRGAR